MRPVNRSAADLQIPAASQTRLGSETILSALLAVWVLQIFRASLHPDPIWMYCELSLFGLLSIVLSYLTFDWWRATDAKRAENRFAVTRQIHNNANYLSQAGAAILFLLLIGWQMTARAFGAGDANEIVALLALQYVALYLALVGFLPGCRKTSMALSGALVFFVCCLSQRIEICFIAGIFSIFAMWGLLGMYWSQLDGKAIDGQSKRMPLRRTSVAATLVVVLLALGLSFLLPKTDMARSIRGFSPFSGGEDGFESAFARDGIGEGEMLTGGDNATTTGAVDTDQFIEDHKPSLYDVMSDMYDGPVFKKRKSRAVSLDAQSKHIHDLKKSEMAGRTFRTMRKSSKTSDIKLENKTTDALFFVEGSVPARFAIGQFQNFDGWDWTVVDTRSKRPMPPRIHMNKKLGKPFFTHTRARIHYLSGDRAHRLKMMRLETASLPTTPFLSSWHIDQVDNVDFFKRDASGQVKYDGEAIPAQTVIDMYSYVPNYHTMRRIADLRKDDRFSSNNLFTLANRHSDLDSPYLQMPPSISKSKIDTLVADWTAGIEPGWNQVEAIVEHVRSDFNIVDDLQIDELAENSVTEFIEHGGGPSYMFATTCAMALRTAGYKTRLTSGFVVRKTDFDRVSGQSVVNGDAVHLWPEVCLDGQYWIPIEPTPGYPVPFSVATIWQHTTALFFYCLRVMQNNLTLVLSIFSAAVFVVLKHRLLVTIGWLVGWHLVRVVWPAGLLGTTRRLLDARFWAAGRARPGSQTIKHWYSQIDPQLPQRFFNLWNAKNFFDSYQPASNDQLVNCCQEQIRVLTVSKIKKHFNPASKGSSDVR